jgi:tetratricopeptide (TPR) repeat protein
MAASSAIVFAISAAVYANTLWNGFVYDDIQQIVENPWVRSASYLPDIFLKDVWGFAYDVVAWNYYRPLMHVSYMASYFLFGLKPWGFHLVSVLVHASVSVLVLMIVARAVRGARRSDLAPGWPTLAGAALFAVHPIHTEAVAWLAGIPDLAVTFFCLLAFLLHLRADEVERPWRFRIASVACFAVALLWKETALVLPVLVAAHDVLVRGRRIRDRLPSWAVYAFPCLLYFALRAHVLGGVAPFLRHPELGVGGYVANVFPLLGQYLAKLAIPAGLNAFHVLHPISSLLAPRGLVSLLATAGLAACAIAAFRTSRPALMGLAWTVVPLLPVLYIPALGENTFAERYLYLPSVGLSILVALVLGRAAREPKLGRVAAAATAVLLAVFAVGTVRRNAVWRDDLALWTDTIRKSPDAAVAHNHLGVALEEAGRVEEALEHFRAATRLDSRSFGAWSNLGMVLAKQGRPDEAVGHFRTALAIRPVPGIHVNLGDALEELGRLDEAIAEYETAVRLAPRMAEARVRLGVAYGEKGLLGEALRHLRAAVELAPEDPVAHHNLANACRLEGLVEEAERHSRLARELEAR